MKKEFVPYELAVELKELGFNEECLGRHCIVTEWEKPTGKVLFQLIDCLLKDTYLVKAPLYSQAFRFFRNKYNIDSRIERDWSLQDLPKQYCYVLDTNEGFEESINYNNYEEAELTCLINLIKLINNDKSN